MPIKCVCPNTCRLHDLCKCGELKGVRSKTCRKCYIPAKNPHVCNCGQPKHRSSINCMECGFYERKRKAVYRTTPIGKCFISGPNQPGRYVRIRDHARFCADFYGLTGKGCFCCGFPLEQVCHIKDISEFSPDTPICEVNAEDNLIVLCPNCHWLFDHGYPSVQALRDFISEIKGPETG